MPSMESVLEAKEESVLEAKEAEDCRGAACMLDLPTECLQQCFPPRSVQLGIRVCR